MFGFGKKLAAVLDEKVQIRSLIRRVGTISATDEKTFEECLRELTPKERALLESNTDILTDIKFIAIAFMGGLERHIRIGMELTVNRTNANSAFLELDPENKRLLSEALPAEYMHLGPSRYVYNSLTQELRGLLVAAARVELWKRYFKNQKLSLKSKTKVGV